MISETISELIAIDEISELPELPLQFRFVHKNNPESG
jgi:hypothetical protein